MSAKSRVRMRMRQRIKASIKEDEIVPETFSPITISNPTKLRQIAGQLKDRFGLQCCGAFLTGEMNFSRCFVNGCVIPDQETYEDYFRIDDSEVRALLIKLKEAGKLHSILGIINFIGNNKGINVTDDDFIETLGVYAAFESHLFGVILDVEGNYRLINNDQNYMGLGVKF